MPHISSTNTVGYRPVDYIRVVTNDGNLVLVSKYSRFKVANACLGIDYYKCSALI